MYKSKYVNGDEWFEYIKMGAKDFRVYKIHGDGSHHHYMQSNSLKTARDTAKMQNHLHATKGGLNKVAHMTEGLEYLTKEDFTKYSKQPEMAWGA